MYNYKRFLIPTELSDHDFLLDEKSKEGWDVVSFSLYENKTIYLLKKPRPHALGQKMSKRYSNTLLEVEEDLTRIEDKAILELVDSK